MLDVPVLDVPVSLLDRARTRAGEPDAAALTGVVDRARRAEALGYHRVWVAEHHAVPGVAGSAPAVLAAALLAGTRHVRVGSGGVMLPNHAPLVVAEQFATLAALHPGRVDLGVGRSPGFTAPVRRALRRPDPPPSVPGARPPGRGLGDEAFAADVQEVLDHLAGRAEVTARPQVGPVPVLVLATGGGLRVAARLGLPVVVGGPLVQALLGQERAQPGPAAQALAALEDYRSAFRPREGAGEDAAPRVLLAVDVLVADDPATAADLALPEARAAAVARTTGSFPPLEPVPALHARAPSGAERRHLDAAGGRALTGDPDEVGAALARLVGRTGAAELVVTSSTTDRAALARSDALLAGLSGPARTAARLRGR